MKIIIQRLGWALFWLIAAFICSVACAVLAALLPSNIFFSCLAGALGFICLCISFIGIREASKGAIKINEVDQRLYDLSDKSFDKPEDFQNWFYNIFDDLKEYPSERLLHLHQIANTISEACLKDLILWCVNIEPELLSSNELNILRRRFVKRFSVRTDQLLDSTEQSAATGEALIYVIKEKVVEYYHLTGKYANTPDLAYGLLRCLSAKNLMETNRLHMCIDLERALTLEESLESETIHALYAELIKQNANKNF